MHHLHVIKRYFLCGSGDFFSHFLDVSKKELSKPISKIEKDKLKAALDVCVGDVKVEDSLLCTLEKYNLLQQLELVHGVSSGSIPNIPTENPIDNLFGFELFSLDYAAKWPLTLVLSRKALTKYQLLFRHIFHLKRVQQILQDTWLSQQSVKEYRIGDALSSTFALRQRMIYFLQNLIYYVGCEVIEPQWHVMLKAMEKARSIDDVLTIHQTFLDDCLKGVLLTNQELLKTLSKLTSTCTIFADQMARYSATTAETPDSASVNTPSVGMTSADRAYARATRIELETRQMLTVSTSRDYIRIINRFRNTFDGEMETFINKLEQTAQTEANSYLKNLLTRLNFNSMFSFGSGLLSY
eukprot:TRINITY_DN4468_c0_g1_i4.p1 TRINITY_DN4468_c0_g1~~TRINITY_DN4468_c0_g1_i4.p1  ORF type:complete len:354 (+),score=72.69 TRINITY_DN4468_c0_g1_i4:61-1122(+)